MQTKDKDICPYCNASMIGNLIPKEQRCNDSCPKPFCLDHSYRQTPTHFSRIIGIEVNGLYDGVLFWQCPDCNGTWHRWSDEYMREKAERYIHGPTKELK